MTLGNNKITDIQFSGNNNENFDIKLSDENNIYHYIFDLQIEELEKLIGYLKKYPQSNKNSNHTII